VRIDWSSDMYALVTDAGVDPSEVEDVLLSAKTKVTRSHSERLDAWGTTEDGSCLWIEFMRRDSLLLITGVEAIECEDMP